MNRRVGVLIAGVLLLVLLAVLRFWSAGFGPAAPPAVPAPHSPSAPGPERSAAPAIPAALPAVRGPSVAQAIPPVREQLLRAAGIVEAYFTQKTDELPAGVRRPQDWATNLPLGWFQLLTRAFPDQAFEIFSAQYLGDPDHETVAYWALGELARLHHEPTFQLFNAQLENADPVRARRALKVLANYDTPQMGPRILAITPEDPKDADQAELLRTALLVGASTSSTDSAALNRLLDRFDERAQKIKIDDYYGTAESRLRATVMRSDDVPKALADAVAKETKDHQDDLERADWAADMAVRSGRRELVGALQGRIQKELDRLKENDRLGDLDILGNQARGRFDVPSVGTIGSLEEVRTIAHLRRAILDLGGTLSDEDRRWLDGLRMLRTPKEYLREAGLIE
jgi:hypothetical protein